MRRWSDDPGETESGILALHTPQGQMMNLEPLCAESTADGIWQAVKKLPPHSPPNVASSSPDSASEL